MTVIFTKFLEWFATPQQTTDQIVLYPQTLKSLIKILKCGFFFFGKFFFCQFLEIFRLHILEMIRTECQKSQS